jgi:hypothetical protein
VFPMLPVEISYPCSLLSVLSVSSV